MPRYLLSVEFNDGTKETRHHNMRYKAEEDYAWYINEHPMRKEIKEIFIAGGPTRRM